jgi:hypothetical protein
VKIAGDTDIAEFLKRISLDDFVRTLPTGQSRISFTARGQQETASMATEAVEESL